MKRLLMLLLALCLMAGAACAETVPCVPAAEITATGVATLKLPADRAVLTLHITGRGDTVDEAQTQAEASLGRLVDALLAAGVSQADLHTAHWDVEVLYEYHYTKLSQTQICVGYSVSTSVDVSVHDVDTVGALVTAAAADGVGAGYELVFQSTQTESAYTQALASATQDAVAKAQQLAQSCGVELDSLLRVTEVAPLMDDRALVVTATVEVAYSVK